MPLASPLAPTTDPGVIPEVSVAYMRKNTLEKVEIVSAMNLPESHWDIWESIRAESPHFRSPFFSAMFMKTAARLRRDAKIAIFRDEEKISGFLPFEESSKGLAMPLGGQFNDAHGVLCSPSNPITYTQLAATPELPDFRFHALDGILGTASPYVLGHCNSYLADLAAHPQGYVAFLEQERGTILKQRRKTKKLIKDLGPLRLDFDCHQESVLESLFQLKRDHYRRTHIFDILSVEWARQLIQDLWQLRGSECRGVLSALYAGKQLVAVHYGMLEREWLHYWFPTYDPTFHQYSPGTALFLEIARQAKSLGIEKIDMGYGEQPYKHKLTDSCKTMAFGLVTASPWRKWKEQVRLQSVQLMKQVPFKGQAKQLLRSVCPSWGRSKYE